MLQLRAVGWVTLAAGFVLSGDRARADELRPGDQVLAKAADVQFWEGKEPRGAISPGMLLEVAEVRGEWLWVARGWVRKQDMVAAAEASSFFTPQIERHATPFALVSRAAAAFRLHSFDAAIADCGAAIRLDARCAPAYSLRGRSYVETRTFELALADLNVAIQIDPKLAGAYCSRAQAWAELGQNDKALADYSRAIELDPAHPRAYSGRGLLLSRQGELEKAIADLSRAIELNPRHAAPYNNRANVYFKQADYARAVADYTAALCLEPRADVYFNRAIAWSRLGHHDEAIADYTQTIRLNPSCAPAYYHRANLRLRTGEPAKAEEDFRRANQSGATDKST
jgi:tetratricopeptide (TPR) repeat protein